MASTVNTGETVEAKLIKEKEKNVKDYISDVRDAVKRKDIVEKLDDANIVKFLRSRLYDVKETASFLEEYISNFDNYPHFYNGVKFARPAIEANFFKVLPGRTAKGEAIAVCRVDKWDPYTIKWDQLIASAYYAIELALEDQETQMNGMILVADTSGCGFRFLANVGFSDYRMTVRFHDNMVPLRFKFCFISGNIFFRAVYALYKWVASERTKDAVMFIGPDKEKLNEIVPLDLLPPDFFGTKPDIDPKTYYQTMKKREVELANIWKPFRRF